MTSIDIFYQGEGIRGIEHLEVDPDHTFAAVKALIVEKHGLENDVLLFLEDSDEPLDELMIVTSHVGQAGIKAHLHRCRHIEVAVTLRRRDGAPPVQSRRDHRPGKALGGRE